MYELLTRAFRSPRGAYLWFLIRNDSSDFNTIQSCTTEDEYGLAERHLEGLALDIGAHIGGVTISLLADNPEFHVVAVEAVPDNADLLWRNAKLNNLTDRLTVINGAAAAPGVESETVAYGYSETENGRHHAFIGNTGIVGPEAHIEVTVPAVSLGQITAEHGPASFMKIDAEGAEWGFLADRLVDDIALIVGEAHPTNGHRMADLEGLLPNHQVNWADPPPGCDPAYGPLGFTAVRRQWGFIKP